MIFECHGHIILDDFSYSDSIARHEAAVDEAFVRKNLKVNAEHGVAFYRDGGDRHGVSAYARKVAHEYGIDYRSPIYIIHKKGHYGHLFGRAYSDLSEYRGLVDQAKQLGADFIKLTASGMLDFAGDGAVTGKALSSETLCDIINIAHGEGFSVMVHVNGADNIKRTAEAGADSLEHGFFMDDDALSVISQTGAVWVPTIATVANQIGKGNYDDKVLTNIFDGHKAALRSANAMGIPIACGSDAGAACVPQGIGAHNELAILKSLGIDPTRGNKIIEEAFKRA